MNSRCWTHTYASSSKHPRCLDPQVKLFKSFNVAYLSDSPIELLRTPSSVVLKLAQTNQFDEALATARSLGVDMTDVFSELTTQCLQLARRMDIDA